MTGFTLRSLCPGKESTPRQPLNRRLRGYHILSGPAGEETILFPMLGLGPRAVEPVGGIGELLLLFCIYWSSVTVYVGACGCMSFKVARYNTIEIMAALNIQ
jgi:hypothetical protein